MADSLTSSTSYDYTFGTLSVAMVTPFTNDGAVDYNEAQKLANKLVDEGCDSLVVTGTTGETSTLTDEENVGMFKAVLEAVGDRAKVIAGTGTNDTAHSINLSGRAAEVGVHGLLIVTPYYNKPSQAGVQAHFEAIASATDLPVMVYDIPGRAGIAISSETLVRLAEHPNIKAVKDAKADYLATTRVMAQTDLDYYSGDDGLTLPLMAAGAVGLVSVTAHVATRQYRQLVDAMHAGDLATARKLHFELDPVQRAMMTHIQGAVATKTILHRQNVLPNAVVRLPLVQPSDAELQPVLADLREAGWEI
ncbi:4-hydroxy-tetrahydrodipicolinate synthase [Neomicrococcus aestuarii]|uniref:4-hydroxy-tetrahydrodipicolinate synthase n=1 Tax=Neomicrococcus aestuarii TaxID=556325 RepID=A0A7W8X0E2_9MICC|nr:4-hydroxy-tetrahydrodipicolinate synthase [Neomicrococcus aestuarii]MBB5511624.1 4-hydroxy-tetrahydrodipicolinate synthase [Neomicrococcus aestuarii]